MKLLHIKYYFLVILFFLISPFSFSQKHTEVDYLIENVSIIPMSEKGILKNRDIAIKDGKIIAIVNTNKGHFVPKQKIQGKGKYILPTLGDAHVHLPEEDKDIEKYLTLNLINGVTKVRSLRGDIKHLEWRAKYNTAATIYPKMYLSSPVIHRSYDLNEEQLTRFVQKVKESGFDYIKILSVKDENVYVLLNKAAKENNVKLVGHFPDTVIKDSIIFNSQLNSIEHLGGLIGIEEATLKNRINAIKNNSIFICPTLDWYVIGYGQYSIDEMKNRKGMQFIAPETMEDWTEKTVSYREKMGKADFEAEVAKYAVELKERYQVLNQLDKEGVKLLLSPDSSSRFIVPGFGMLGEMQIYQKAGLSNYAILKAATVNFADYFADTSYGTIEVGKNADFMVLNENPMEKIEAVQDIESIFYNNHFLDKKTLTDLANGILN